MSSPPPPPPPSTVVNEMSSILEQFELAKSLYEKGHYVRSQEACETLDAQLPNNVNVILLWSASFYMQGKYDKSLECLKKVPVKYRKYVEILNNVAANHLKKYHYETAYDEYCRAVCKKEDYMEGWYGSIKTLIKTENYENAIDALAEIIRYDSDSLMLYILSGQLLLKLNRFEKARSMFQLAIQQEPESEVSWAGLGDSYAFNKQFHVAIICYEKAYEINKSSMNHLINLGFMYYEIKQFNKSIEMLNIAISKMDPITNVDILPILGRAYFCNGNIVSAAQTYCLYLKYKLNNPELLHAMGLIYSEHFNNPAATQLCFKSCAALDKRNALYHECLFDAYCKLEQHELAFKTAIKLAETFMLKEDLFYMNSVINFANDLLTNDDYYNYYTNLKLGTIYHMLEFKRDALLRYENAKRMKPGFSLAYSKIALLYEEENRLEDAEEFYEKAYNLSLHSLPHNQQQSDNIHNLIAIKQRRGLIDNVIGLYNHRLNHCCKSDRFVIHTHLANYFYNEVGNIKEAYNHFLKASEICDNDSNTYLALGKLSLELKYNNDVLNYFWKALELNPNCISAHVYIGFFYKQLEQFNEAINEFEKALNLRPNYPNAYDLLIHCQRHICKFINLDALNKFKDIIFQQLNNEEEPSISIEHSLLCDFEPEVLKQITSAYAKQYVNKQYVQRSSRYVHNISLSNSCIRVGYIYKDSSSHPTSELVKSIRRLHDRNKFEVFCYSVSPTNRFRSNNLSASDCCIDISNLCSIDAAKKINSDGIHILIDVGNKNLAYEIFVLKPAPIQVKLHGHPGTSGATFIDYLITDEKCSPPKLDCLYTEKLAYLNRTVFFGDHGLLFNDLSQRTPQNRTTNFKEFIILPMYSTQMLPDDSIKYYTRQMYNLPEDAIVYCYFGKLYKINQTTINMWVTILKSVNNSVLWLLQSIKDAENNMHAYVAMNGIDPVRVIFSNVAPKEEHLRRIQLADIFLDTPIYNSHRSCLDALWAGIPVITLSGNTFASRMATSILSALNCIQTIAMTENDYIRIAIKLGTHTTILDQLRQQIWHSRTTSELFDYKSYCNELENLYLHMWNKYELLQ